MRDELRRMALFGTGIAELTRYRAEQIVKDLVRSGDVRREQTSSLVKELLDRSREVRGELGDFVRAEIRNQIAALGLVSAREVERLERRVTRLEDRLRAQGAPSSTGGAGKVAGAPKKSASRKKKTTRKTTRKKTTTRRAGGGSPA